jgi:hypothetical protein
MTIQEQYDEALKYNFRSLIALIEYLVYVRKVLKMTDDSNELNYYLQDRFKAKMNEYLGEYFEKRFGNV